MPANHFFNQKQLKMITYKNLRIALIATFFLFLIAQSFAQTDDWQLVSSDENIEVFTRQTEESDFKEVRVKAVFHVSTDKLMETLNDVENYSKWVYKCKDSYKVKINNKNDYIYYSETQMPTLIANRDLVIHSKQWMDEKTGIAWSVSKSKQSFMDSKLGIIRIEEFESKWKIEPINPTKTAIDYTIRTNPGGKLPVWLVNMGVTVGPVQTMKNLRQIIEKKNSGLLAQKMRK